MKKSIVFYLFIVSFSLCKSQTFIRTINEHTIIGKYIGSKKTSKSSTLATTEFVNIKVKKNKHYVRRDFTIGNTEEISRGKWILQNDTLVLCEKFYQKRPITYWFAFRKKIKNEPTRIALSKLVLQNGRWIQMEGNSEVKQVYSQYILKRTKVKWERVDWLSKA